MVFLSVLGDLQNYQPPVEGEVTQVCPIAIYPLADGGSIVQQRSYEICAPNIDRAIRPGRKRSQPNLSCSTCGKLCPSRRALDIHMNSHTGARPYTCSLCGLGFASKSNMNSHRAKLHTYTKNCPSFAVYKDCENEREFYRCPLCNSRFAHTRTCHSHMRDQHGVNSYFPAEKPRDECTSESFVKSEQLVNSYFLAEKPQDECSSESFVKSEQLTDGHDESNDNSSGLK